MTTIGDEKFPPLPEPPEQGITEWIRQVLRDRREKLGLTQQQVADRVAERMGIDSLTGQTIGNYEKRAREPRIDELAKWADSLGLRLHVLLDDVRNRRFMVLVAHTETAAIARLVDRIDSKEKREAILNLVRTFG